MGEFTDNDRETLTEIRTIVKANAKTLEDHETRIRASEQFKNRAYGYCVGIAAAVSGGVMYLPKAAAKLFQ